MKNLTALTLSRFLNLSSSILLALMCLSPLMAQSVKIAEVSTVTQFHFTPQITKEMQEAFREFEEYETRNFELKHGDGGPLKYETYRLNPPSVRYNASHEELDEAAKLLGMPNPSSEERRKILIAHALSQVLPAQMRAGDKHPKIKPARIRYAADYLYDSLRKAGELRDFASRSRAIWANNFLYRKTQIKLGLKPDEILASEQICNDIDSSALLIDWSFSDQDIEPYFYLKDQPPTQVSLGDFNCDSNESPDKIRDRIYKALQPALKKTISNSDPIFFESLFFVVKKLGGFSVDFNEIPYDLFLRWHNEDLSGWTVVEFPVPTKPFENELDVQEHIFDTLNLIYIEDKFRWSIIRYAEASSSEGRRRFRDAEEVDFREVKEHYENIIETGKFEDRPLQISLVSASLQYLDPQMDDQIESIYAEELKITRDELATKAIELMTRPYRNQDRKDLEEKERKQLLYNLKKEAFKNLVSRIGLKLSLSPKDFVVEPIRGLSGSFNEILTQVKGRSWEAPLIALKDRYKETQKPQLFPIITPVLSIDSETQTRLFRVGLILAFEAPGLYDLQLSLADSLSKKAQEDLFLWSYDQLFREAFSFSLNGSTPWHHCLQDFGIRSEELTPKDAHPEILKLAARLHHAETKKPKRGVDRAYLRDDFIPRIKKDDAGGFFGLFP